MLFSSASSELTPVKYLKFEFNNSQVRKKEHHVSSGKIDHVIFLTDLELRVILSLEVAVNPDTAQVFAQRFFWQIKGW